MGAKAKTKEGSFALKTAKPLVLMVWNGHTSYNYLCPKAALKRLKQVEDWIKLECQMIRREQKG
jgi:hypothetical protein